MAAGIVLVREAGGFVTDIEGKRDMLGTGSVVAAAEKIHPQLLKLVK